MAENWGRITWLSRRGMRELDLMLLPFVAQDLPALGAADVAAYVDLLQASDLELMHWLHGTAPADTPERRRMVALIRARHATRRGREGV